MRRAELLSLVEASPEEIAFDVRTALAKDPATRGMDEFAMRTLAERIAEHLAQARLRFTRKVPAPLRSTGSVGVCNGTNSVRSLTGILSVTEQRVNDLREWVLTWIDSNSVPISRG